MKDWLKNDPAFTLRSAGEIEDFINRSPELSICADLCNGLKHLSLKNPRSGKTTGFGRKIESATEVSVEGTVIKRSLSRFIEIQHGDKVLNAFQVATTALQLWDSFIHPV